MKELLEALQKQINTLIALHFYHKADGVIQKVADASYSVYLKNITDLGNSVEFKFTNGMDNAGKSEFTVSVPSNAQSTKVSDTEWTIEYTSGETALLIKLFLTQTLKVAETNKTVERPAIREVRNEQGALEKLEIATPDNGVSIDFITNVKSILSQVLGRWGSFTLSSPDKTDEENKIIYEFEEIETVTLPGNTFFEIVATSPQGTTNLEVSTSLNIDLKNSQITFMLEDFPITIKKHILL